MTKSNLRIANMNKKIRLIACLGCLITTTGCYLFQPINYKYDDEDVTTTAPTELRCPENGPCITPPVATNDYVEYTEVAADYREYGERTPRDQRIVQSGPGSNMSAAIPPTIDEEVGAYEEEIKSSGNGEFVSEDDGNGGASAEAGDDPVKDWLAEEGKSLKTLLTEWSDESGWRLIWNTNRNYTLNAGAMFRGRFADVSAALIRAFGRARPAPIATFYKGNRVLVVETMEDENAYN